jgi:hypothetical protein
MCCPGVRKRKRKRWRRKRETHCGNEFICAGYSARKIHNNDDKLTCHVFRYTVVRPFSYDFGFHSIALSTSPPSRLSLASLVPLNGIQGEWRRPEHSTSRAAHCSEAFPFRSYFTSIIVFSIHSIAIAPSSTLAIRKPLHSRPQATHRSILCLICVTYFYLICLHYWTRPRSYNT